MMDLTFSELVGVLLVVSVVEAFLGLSKWLKSRKLKKELEEARCRREKMTSELLDFWQVYLESLFVRPEMYDNQEAM